MDAGLVTLLVAALGTVASGFTVFQSRRKIAAEAEKEKANRESILVNASESLVGVVMRQLDFMDGEIKKLQATVNEYRSQVENATRQENALRAEITSLKTRVSVLEGFIKAQGWQVP